MSRKKKRQDWFLRTSRRIAAPLLVAGIMTFGGRADAIDTMPLLTESHKEKHSSQIIMTYKFAGKIIYKLKPIGKLKPKLKSPIKFNIKPIKLKQIRRLLKTFKPMTKPEKSKHR
jgi:hypothetical protein